MRNRSRKTIELPNYHSVEMTTMSVMHRAVEFGRFSFAPEIPMSTYSPATVHLRRSACSRSSRVCKVGSWELFAVRCQLNRSMQHHLISWPLGPYKPLAETAGGYSVFAMPDAERHGLWV